MTAEDRAALVANVKTALDDFSTGVDMQYWSRPLKLLRDLLADHVRLVQERDEARQAATELLEAVRFAKDQLR